jgi:predicted NBD/HSP70 family sugar kinase
MASYIAFDWGGTSIKHALMDEGRNVLARGSEPTPDASACDKDGFLSLVDGIVEGYRGDAAGIAVSMPGTIDPATGHCFSAGSLTYLIGSGIADELSSRYGLPCTVINDGKAAALAELRHGSLKGCRNAAAICIGSGIAGGIIIDGKPYLGTSFSAGEYSFVVTDWRKAKEDWRVYWGIECGVYGLARLVASRTGDDADQLDGRTIFERAGRGDEDVLGALRDWCDDMAVQIHNVNTILDLERIAIGGGISREPLMLPMLKEAVEDLEREMPVRHSNPSIPSPTIVPAAFLDEASIIGALDHHLDLYGDRF